MFRDSSQSHDPSSMDNILKNLANRPNVQSTLILSRKDGSIIRSTGLSTGSSSSNLATRSYDGTSTSALNTTTSPSSTQQSKSEDTQDDNADLLSPAQRLASSIHEFVNISSKLAANVSRTQSSASDTTYGATTLTQQQSHETAVTDEEDVQLLRMRTKKQEIIIFPDPNYLCCVVQSISKTSGRSEPA